MNSLLKYSLNNLTTTILSIGQILQLPQETNLVNTYIVKKGDSLYKIAQTYNTTVSQLMKLNNLDNTIINVGQIIKLK